MSETRRIHILTFWFLLGFAPLTSIPAEPLVEIDQRQPWTVNGIVVTESGAPLPDAEIIAHTGIGSLKVGGRTKSKADGTFEMRFGPGFYFKNQEGVQAATISVRKEGWFETNLYRQGDLLAAFKKPAGEIGWGEKTIEDVFLPGQPKTLQFVMKPAAQISGVLTDSNGTSLPNKRVGITGEVLPPSSSVFAETKANEKGEFHFKDLSTTHELKLYVESGKNWREWPGVTVKLGQPKQFKVTFKMEPETLNFSSEPPLQILKENVRLEK